MSSPDPDRTARRLVDLALELSLAPTVSPGSPARIEWDSAVDDGRRWDGLLADALVLGIVSTSDDPAAWHARVASGLSVTERCALIADLRTSCALPPPRVTDASRILRWTLETGTADSARVAAWVAALDEFEAPVVLRRRARAAEAVAFVESLPSFARPLEIRLRAPDDVARRDYAQEAQRLLDWSLTSGHVLDIPGHPASRSAARGERANVFAVSHTVLAGRRVHCPFPFFLARRTDGGMGLCPRSDGPTLDWPKDVDGVTVWSGADATAVRRSMVFGPLPEGCRTCALAARVQRALALPSRSVDQSDFLQR